MTSTHIKKFLISSASILAISATSSIAAQDDDDGISLEEIVVTAQKRSQNMQDVPIALTAISSTNIEKLAADNMRDLAIFTPGLEVGGNTQARFTMRGVSTDDFGVGTDPAVAVYVDGVYSTRSGASLVMFNDVERVEILKGPQGTLFGRNTAAGAVSITTKQPNFDGFEATIDMRYGRYDKKKITSMVNIPLADNLALRANLVVNRRDGFVKDGLTGEDYGREANETGRIRLRWEPSDNTAVTFSYEFDHTDQDDDGVLVGLGDGSIRYAGSTLGDNFPHNAVIAGIAPMLGLPLDDDTPMEFLINNVPLANVYGGLQALLGYDPSRAGSDWDFIRDPNTPGGANLLGPVRSDIGNGRETRNLDGFSIRVEHEFDWATLTSISSFKKFDTSNLQDEDGTNYADFYFDTDNVEKNEHFYQELRFNGSNDSFTWAAGGSFYKEKAYQRSNTLASTDSIDTTLYNVGATAGVLAAGLDFADGINNPCENAYFDTWSSYVRFSDLPMACFDPALGALAAGLGLDGMASIEDIANNLYGTSWYGREWREDMIGTGRTTSWGIFFDGTWHATEKLNITAGIRYTSDKKSWHWENGRREISNEEYLAAPAELTGALAAAGIPGINSLADLQTYLMAAVIGGNGDLVFSGEHDFMREDSWDYISPRVVVDYHVNDNMMLWGSWSLGHKSGGHNSVEVNSVFENEEVTNVEAGMKSTWLDGRMRLNVSGWSYRYNDKQSIRLVDVNGSGIPQYTTDTQDIKGKGIDMDMEIMATQGLRIFANASYQDITCANNCTSTTGGVTYDTTGEPVGAPDLIAAIGVDYTYEISESMGSLNFNTNHSYTSAGTENSACQGQGSCGMVTWGASTWRANGPKNFTNARISWTNSDEDIKVSFYGTNIFNKKYLGGAGGLLKDTMYAARGSVPMGGTYGMDIGFKF